jgi:signal transduction histidine kinase/CheY-like chemotaxis protein
MPGAVNSMDERGPERFFRMLLAVAIAAPLLLFVAAAWYDHEQVIETARRHVLTTAEALAEHAQKVIESSQLALALITDRVSGLDWNQIGADPEVHGFLVRLTQIMPELESAFLVTPEGTNSASSRAFPMRPFDVHERQYFQVAKAGRKELFISPPFRGQMAGTTAFTLSRPRDLNNPGDGLVALTLSPNYFERFYSSIAEAGLDGSISLLRDDGEVLARYPDSPSFPAKMPAGALFPPTLYADAESGVLAGRALRDGVLRIGAFQRLRGFPLVATYSVKVDAVLVDWYRHIAVIAAFAFILAAVLVYATRGAMLRARHERENLRLLIAETRRREQAEEAVRQLQKIEALGRLTGGVAHDFNNLLTAVMGSLELALKRVSDPRVTRLLTGAMEAANRGARLTQHMLAFARQQNVRMLPVSVNATLRGMDEMLRRTIGPQIVVEYALDEDLWPAVADPTQLEVAVLNLGINGRDAMPLGGSLRLTTDNLAAGAPRPSGVPDGEMVVVSISDTGEGMTEEVRGRAIEPFFTTKGVGRGTGLGLSMADGIARQAGGGLAIESQPGRGTTIRVFLPRARDLAAAEAEAEAVAGADEPVDMLLVDDDAQVRALAAEMLSELGHRVTQAEDGPGAIAKLREHPEITLMIVDYAMPGMNGGEVARRVAQLRADLAMVFVTGYADRGALQEWTARGYPLLAKPFTLPRLAEAIAASLERQAKVINLRTRSAAG